MSDYYQILGINKDADDSQIKKAYRNLAKQYHPDKVQGHEEQFKEISEAYEVLIDPEKRQAYDMYRSTSEFDLGFNFSNNNASAQNTRRKSQKQTHELEVTLEQLYKGDQFKFMMQRIIECQACQGAGGKRGTETGCRSCKGSGRSLKLRQVSNHQYQPIHVPCSSCKGKGSVFSAKDRCRKCKSSGSINLKELIEVFIDRGMVNNQKIKFTDKADQQPGNDPGDLYFIVNQLPHPTFQRSGLDLSCEIKVSLKDVLLGFDRVLFKHLDGRPIRVEVKPGQISKFGQIMKISELGMPQYKDPSSYGDLYITFLIELPTQRQLQSVDLNALRSLPDLPEVVRQIDQKDSNSADKFEVTTASENGFGKNLSQGEHFTNFDEEEEQAFFMDPSSCNQM